MERRRPGAADDAGFEVGQRIALFRRLNYLTQRGLADRAHVSYSLLTKVETGNRPASPGFVAACARALGLDVAELAGRPPSSAPESEQVAALLAPIRTALDLFDVDPDETIRPRAVPQLAAAVRQVNQLAQAAKYPPMMQALPGLLAELHTAAHTFTGADQRAAWGLLAEAYRCGHSVGIAVGMNDLSTSALARMDWAAQHAGDREPGLRTAREYLRVTAYLRQRDYDTAWRLNATGRRHLEGTDAHTPGAVIASGQLHLGAAVIAARTGDRDTVNDHLDAARRIAAQTGEDTETFWFGFGPTNVRVHRAMTLVELGDYAAAVDVGEHVEFPSTWLPTRIGHHHFDLARAYRWMNRPDEALDHLLVARQVAPQQARRHPSVRETVAALVRADHHHNDELARYANWIGL